MREPEVWEDNGEWYRRHFCPDCGGKDFHWGPVNLSACCKGCGGSGVIRIDKLAGPPPASADIEI